MYISKWKQNDGYEEAIASFEEGSAPLLRLRVVKDGEGKYEAVIRETTERGHMLASGHYRTTLHDAKVQAVEKMHILLSQITRGPGYEEITKS